MPLSGILRAPVRPRGGVTRVELIPAYRYAGGAPPPGSVWEFREDRARYREEAAGESNLSLLSRHILEMELPAEPAARAAAARLRETAAAEGVVAIVTMASGEILTVGYSERFAGEYPLRVAEQATDCGLVPGDFPVIRITLESTY